MRALRTLALVALAAGCGKSAVATYPVSGTVALAGADAAALAGHHVEAALADDPAVRASGVIGADGRFALQTLDGGEVRPGARAGRYDVRIVLDGEDDDGRKAKKPRLAARYLTFKASGLALDVPAGGDVTFQLTAK
jgi:hypothetical protein